MNNHRLIITYYTLGALVLVGQALFTLYQSSQVIHYGQEVAQLETERHDLSNRQQELREQIAHVNSLSQVANSAAVQDFTLVTSTVNVVESNVVAAR